MIYRGAIRLDTLLDDVAHLADAPPTWRERATPLTGRWLAAPTASDMSMAVSAAKAFMQHEDLDGAAYYVSAIRRQVQIRLQSANISPAQRSRLAESTSGLHANLARAMIEGGRQDDAQRALEQAVQINPNDAFVHNNLASLLMTQRQFEQAIVHYRRCLILQPKSAQMHVNIGMAYAALAQADEAIENYKRAISFESNWAVPYVQIGIELSKVRQFEEAIANFQRALAIRPDFSAAHYHLANAHTEQRKFDDAVRHYRAALETQPHDASTHAGLGHALFRQGKSEDALVELHEAVQTDPQLPMARLYLAIVLRQQGKRESALAHFEEAIRLAPDWTTAYSELAKTHQLLGNDAEAIRYYRQVLRSHDSLINSDLLINTAKRLAWVLATHPDATLRNGSEALHWATAACEAVQNHEPDALATVAVAYAECGQFREAVTAIEKALEITPTTDANNARNKFEKMLELFQSNRPYRQNSGKPANQEDKDKR